MRLGVVSDTHGHTSNALSAVRMLESLDVAEVLHCGDIGSAEVIALFQKWPAHFVLGNCDSNEAELRAAAATAGVHWHGLFGDLTIAGRRIALLHSHDARKFRQVTTSGEYDLVCYGHTHQAEQHHEGKTLILNPGALYRANPHSIAVVELETMEATMVPI